MAEANSNVSNEEQDEESLFMLCGVCRKASQDSNPKLLPCLHSFCFNCLEERFKQQQEQDPKPNVTSANGGQNISRLKCPTCGQEFLVPQRGITGFLDNQFMLESLTKQTLKKENTERVCTSCEDKSPATSYCLDCTDWLCDACVQAHQRVRVTKDHTVQTMEEYKASASVSDEQRPIFCTIHTHEPLKLFCGNCEKLTCRDCQLLEHKDHKYQFVKESAISYREYLRAQLNRLYEQAQPLTESIKDIEKAARGLQEREEVITAEIHKACETLVKAVKQRESVLVTELKALVHFKHKLLAKQNKDLRLMQKILQHNYGFTRHVLKSSSDMTLLYSKKQLSSRIQNLLSLKYKVNPVAHSDLKFSMDAEKMAAFIGKMGSVITPTDKPQGSSSVRIDSGFRPVASTSGIQQSKPPSSLDNMQRVNPYENLNRMSPANNVNVTSSLTVKLANGQSLSTASSLLGQTSNAHMLNKGVSLRPQGSIVSQPTMNTLAMLKNAEALANHRQLQAANYNKTQPLHHFLGRSPPQRPSSNGSTPPESRPTNSPGVLSSNENGFGQGMITNVRSLSKNSYIRRPSIKRTFSSSGLPTSPSSQPRVKQERQDSYGEFSCAANKKQVGKIFLLC